MTKYLLSTGQSTYKVEEYIIDLFKLNLSILPGDIPRSDIGFDFIMTDVKKLDLKDEVKNRINNLVKKIKLHFSSGINIDIDSIEFINSEKVKLTISVNKVSDNIEINIFNENNTRLY